MPYRQRLSIILSEFGTALAGRGQELSKAIHSANPALRDTDRVLAVLAGQNKTLAQLASDSDRVLSPLAARRKRISDFVVQANATGQATAERSTDLMRTFQRFPTFLRELKPTLADLGALSDEMSPVLVDLGRAAPSLNRFILQLGPFSSAATPALRSLGQATDVGGPALKHSDPLLRDLVRFGQHAAPVTKNLDALTASLDKSGGIERILDYIFFQATAINGFDGISHYLRAELLTNLCSKYTTEAIIGCNANFTQTHSIGTSNGTADASLQRLGAALKAGLARGATKTSAKGGAAKGSGTVNPFDALHQLVDPRAAQARQRTLGQIRNGVQSGRSPAFGRSSASDAALNYLLGNDTP
jgi:hypothetical protein